MAVSDVTTAMTAAQSALASEDYATALDQAIAAQGYLAALPDSMRAGIDRMEWDHNKIQNFIDNIRRRRDDALSTAGGGIQRTKIVHARPSVSTL